MRLEGVAKRYALALVESVPEALCPAVDDGLADISRRMAERPLADVWNHPGIPAADKRRVVERLGLDSWVERFLVLLIEHGRERLLPVAARAFHQELIQRSGRVTAEVRTARPVDPAWRARIVEALASRLGKEVEARFVEDAALLGGIEVRFQDELVDATVRGRLKRLERVLKDGVNIGEA
jgi:F-type H+-transporting ATPase subunit delta